MLVGGLSMPVVVNVLTFYAAVKSFRSSQSPDPDYKQWCDSLPLPPPPSPPPTVTTNTMKMLYILSLSS